MVAGGDDGSGTASGHPDPNNTSCVGGTSRYQREDGLELWSGLKARVRCGTASDHSDPNNTQKDAGTSVRMGWRDDGSGTANGHPDPNNTSGVGGTNDKPA